MVVRRFRYGHSVHIVCNAVIEAVRNDIKVVAADSLVDYSLSLTAAEARV